MELVRAGATRHWAGRVASLVIDRLVANPRLRLCLPTGLTPVPVYEELAAAVARGEASFAAAEIFLLDEFGGVPPDDLGRCDQMLRRALVDRIDVSPGRFHTFALDGDVEAECRRYEALVGEGVDLALLGIGTNGHVGMNEPGSAPDSLTRRVDLDRSTIAASTRYFGRTDHLPTWGVTMGVGTLRRSAEVWIVAAGRGKAAIVRRTLHGPISTAVPATLLRDHPAGLLIADDEAASLA